MCLGERKIPTRQPLNLSLIHIGNDVAKANRSRMNVPFQLADSALDKLFLEESFAAGLHALKGHRVVGGMRASIYNAMPLEGCLLYTSNPVTKIVVFAACRLRVSPTIRPFIFR